MFLLGTVPGVYIAPKAMFAIQLLLAIANVNCFLCDYFVLASISLFLENSSDMQKSTI